MNDSQATVHGVDHESLGKALGKIVTGVYVLTLKSEDFLESIMLSFVQQVSFDPPLIILSVAKNRAIVDSIKNAQKGVLNILHKENAGFFKVFTKPDLSNKDRFEMVDYSMTEYGAILNDSLGYLNLSLYQSIELGCHQTFVFKCDSGNILKSDIDPMTHFRANGFKY